MVTMKSKKQNNRNKKPLSIRRLGRKGIPILAVLIFFIVILTLGIFSIHGLKQVLLETTTASTGGKAYLTIECHNNSSSCLEDAEKNRERHSGKKVGTIKLYQKYYLGGYYEISSSAVSEFLIASLDFVPEDKVPVLIPDGVSLEDLDVHLVPVGVYPKTIFDESNSHNAGIFTPILDQIIAQVKPIYLINDGTGKIEKFLMEKVVQSGVDAEDNVRIEDVRLDDLLTYERQIIVFDDYIEAIDYQRDAKKVKHLTMTDVFSDLLEVNRVFDEVLTIFYWIMGFLILLMLVVAIDVILYVGHRNKNRFAK